MKKIKKIFSLALVGVMAIAGCLMLGACDDKDDESNAKINTALEVLCNMNKENNRIMNFVEEDDVIIQTGTGDVLDLATEYDIDDADKIVETVMDQNGDYFSTIPYSGVIDSACIKLLKCKNFEFGKYFSLELEEGEELFKMVISISMNDTFIRCTLQGDNEEINRDVCDIYDIYYKDNKPVKMISIAASGTYSKSAHNYTIDCYNEYYYSDNEDRAYNNVLNVINGDKLIMFIFSEYHGYSYKNIDLTSGETKDIVDSRMAAYESIVNNFPTAEDKLVELSALDTVFVLLPSYRDIIHYFVYHSNY